MQGSNLQTEIRSSRGISVADALSDIESEVPRSLFWGQTEVVIFGNELAENGIAKVLDFLVRDPNTRMSQYLFIADGKAEDILASYTLLAPTRPDALQMEIDQMIISPPKSINEMLQSLISETSDAVVPIASIHGSGQVDVSERAIFKGDQMIGRADKRISQGIMLIRNEIKPPTTITVTIDAADGGFISFRLLDSKTDLIPSVEGEQRGMTIKIEMDGDIVQNGTKKQLGDQQTLDELGTEVAAEVRARVEKALIFVQQEMQADVFGFGEVIHRKYPHQFKQFKDEWDHIFPALDVSVDVAVDVLRPGLNTSPAGVPKDEVEE